jgi:thymidylate synthase (FAD)
MIERAGRTAYKSEDKTTSDSYKKFIEMIRKRDHGAVLEFGSMMVRFITDRGITHEIVRHRLCSFLQESTRYCNYSDDKFGNECTFIMPEFNNAAEEDRWKMAMAAAEQAYLQLINDKVSPQIARSVLPNSLKTEICVRTNFREWRHIFQLRAISKAAHPQMRALMIPLYEECRKNCPEVFEMGEPE